jgi:ergothioneine biosynthesis protein EgtB
MADLAHTADPAGDSCGRLLERFLATRAATEALACPLEVEDCVVSSMPDVSPTKWHLAHTSWFFETFVLPDHVAGYAPFDSRYGYLFNSYYVQVGVHHARPLRGLATRPTLAEVYEYRTHVTEAVAELLRAIAGDSEHPAASLVELGIHHEQQHQELILTDIQHVLWCNPLRPAYRKDWAPAVAGGTAAGGWVDIAAGVYEIGHPGGGFAFDNESPRHRVFLEPSRLATRLVTNAEYLEFLEDDGYRRPDLWLSAGWNTVGEQGWSAPLFWERDEEGGWRQFTLAGTHALVADAPVAHVSYYEADAFARWKGMTLPTEAAWEVAAAGQPVEARGGDVEVARPLPDRALSDALPSASGVVTSSLAGAEGLRQLYGQVWQWTRSPYVAYPGYRSAAGAIGEYNGKWMADQWVLRGSSCATPATHARATYRNFFPSPTRWQFAGIRLAEEAS